MAVLPPLTDDFVINGGFAAMTLFSIILTICLIRYRAKLDRAESRIEPDAVLWMKDNLMRLSSSEENPAGFTVRKLRYWDLRKRGGARLCSLFVPAARQQKGRPGVLGQLCLVIMLAAAGVMCGTRGSALAQTGTAWSDSVTLPYDAGTYYLTTDVTIGGGGIWIVPSGGVTLDLNGHNVTGCQFRINSGVTLTVKDTKNSGVITFITWPIEVDGGSFHFEGGTLTTSTDSAIVRVHDNGSFSMSGGTITGGRRGVALQNQDSFTMTGGKIIKCSIGVDIWEGSTAEISGGEISGHRSYGIHAVSGTVTMSGGVIKGNQNGIGIGERNNSGTLNLSGGTITGNTHYGISYGNGVLNLSDAPADGATHPSVTENGDANVRILNGVNDLRINVTGPLSPSAILGISMAKPGVFTDGLNNRGTSANFSSDDAPHYDVCLTTAGEAKLGRAVASITSGGVTNRYTSLQDAMDAAQPNDTILLLDNISASTDKFPILAWREDITLDLNGKTISGKPASPSVDLIQIYRMKVGGDYSYGQLTLNDGSAEKSGAIICEAGGCANVINIMGGDPNVLTMYGGKISGGATNVRVNGYFNMHGGEISGGTTNVNSSGQFVMSGGKISGGVTNVICGGMCSMTGGEISGASGNGVTLEVAGVFNMHGGTITGNGQYAIEAFEKSFVFISNGNPIIVSRGSAESSRGIYLHEGSGISIYDTPAAGSSIGVTLESGAGVAARGRSKAPTEDDLAVFHSDEGYAKFLKSAERAIVFGYQISYDAGGAEGDLPDAFVLDPTDTTADPKVPDRGSLTKTGYSFTGWKDGDGNEYAADADFKTLLAQYKPAGSVILTAQWEVNTYAVMLETYGGTINSGDVTQYTYGIGAALPTDVAWDHYSFGGWYDNVDFSGAPVELISASDTGDKTFYAKWIYAVSFDKNASDAQGPLNVSQFFIYNGAEQALLKNSFTRDGYVFSGWNTVQDPDTQSGGKWYWDEEPVRNLPGDGIVTLYAQWEPTFVRIRKVDDDWNEIGGAVVSIFETLSGKPFGTEQTYDPAQGDVIFEGLSIGVKYTVHEVKAPRGYSLAEDKTFVLDEYGFIDLFSADTTVKLIDGIIFLENEPTKVYVRKTDSQSGARLADAQLQLLNTQDGTVSWTSSGTDDREFSGLATGEVYTLHEAAAPSASYAAADDAVFVLDADGSIDPDLTTADYTMEGNNIILLVENVRLYTITFVNEDDSVLESEKWAYGSTPHYTGTLPEKPADASHSYTFAGWSPHVTTVTGDATYKATYTSELNNYTVRFVDEDGTELQTESYAYGHARRGYRPAC